MMFDVKLSKNLETESCYHFFRI